MKKFMLALVLCCMPFMIGCAGCYNDISASGGILGEYSGAYVVISQSGGEIMDCWKMDNVYVQNESNSDGWLFVDNDGNVIRISGDCKVIRINKRSEMDKWHEYHMEFESETYRDLYSLPQ